MIIIRLLYNEHIMLRNALMVSEGREHGLKFHSFRKKYTRGKRRWGVGVDKEGKRKRGRGGGGERKRERGDGGGGGRKI